MKPVIATIECPLSIAAGQPHDATIHQQNSKRQPYYLRCACGTLQPLTETGQMMMQAVMESNTPAAEAPAAKPKKTAKPDDQVKPDESGSSADAKPKSAIDKFLFGNDDDE